MNTLKKAISGVLIAGMLTGGISSAAFAEDNSATSIQTKPMHQSECGAGRGHDLFSTENLQEKISGLSAEVQAEILALAEQLENMQPEKPEQHDKLELDSNVKSEQQDILEQIQTIFADAGITLSTQSDMKERPERPVDETEQPELPADIDKERPELPSKSLQNNTEDTTPPFLADKSDQETDKNRSGKAHRTAITAQIEEQLPQLNAASQAKVQALLEELIALQPTKQQPSVDSAPQSTEQDSTQQLRDALLQLLKDNGITMSPSTMASPENARPDKNIQIEKLEKPIKNA